MDRIESGSMLRKSLSAGGFSENGVADHLPQSSIETSITRVKISRRMFVESDAVLGRPCAAQPSWETFALAMQGQVNRIF